MDVDQPRSRTLRFKILSCALALMGAANVAPVHANTLSAIGGLAFGRNSGMNDVKTPLPLLGAEYMFDLGAVLEFGGSYVENFLSYKSGESGSIRAAGLDARIHPLGIRLGPFADAFMGLARRTQGQNTSGNRFSYGGGVGYEIPIAMRLSMSPHVGVRMLPDSISGTSSRPVVDGALMFSLRI
jgi:hypothetical protein